MMNYWDNPTAAPSWPVVLVMLSCSLALVAWVIWKVNR